MATFYGSDSNCVSDVGLFDLQVTDPIQLIGQRIARRLQTPRGALAQIGDDPNFGWDVKQYINARLSPSSIALAQSQISAECTKDEEVSSATVSMTQSNGAVTISISFISSAGPFSLTMNVAQLTTQLVFTSF